MAISRKVVHEALNADMDIETICFFIAESGAAIEDWGGAAEGGVAQQLFEKFEYYRGGLEYEKPCMIMHFVKALSAITRSEDAFHLQKSTTLE